MRRILLTLVMTAAALPLLAQDGAGVRTPGVEAVVGRPGAVPRTGADLDERTREVASLLRCPVCQGLSISDSPAPMAINMKHQVRDLLAQGYDREQVLDYFESSYGEFVRLDPRFRGIDALVWIIPLLALIAGGIVVVTASRRLHAGPRPVAPATGDPYVDAVRAMAGDVVERR